MESNRAIDGIECLLRPGRVAIIGMSSRSGSAGQIVLNNLRSGGYKGEIHLVGRSGGEIGELPVLTEVAQLPAQIDLAILMVPAEALKDTVRQCVGRQIRSAVAFASTRMSVLAFLSWSSRRICQLSSCCYCFQPWSPSILCMRKLSIGRPGWTSTIVTASFAFMPTSRS